MSLKISEKSRLMPASAIRKLVPLADAAKAEGTKVYHLNVGAPDIKSPDCAFEAVEDCCRKLHHLSYTNSAGLMELRKGLVEKYYRRIGIDIEVSELLVEVAGSEAFANAMQIVADEGDEIIVIEPYYTNYQTFAYLNGITLRAVPTDIHQGFAIPDISEFEKLVNGKTRAVLLSNPCNPSGKLFSRSEMTAIGEFCRRHDLFLISDEVYREFCYTDEPHFSAMNIPGCEQNVILVDSVSKRYNLCGARIGCIVSHNKDVMAAAMKYARPVRRNRRPRHAEGIFHRGQGGIHPPQGLRAQAHQRHPGRLRACPLRCVLHRRGASGRRRRGLRQMDAHRLPPRRTDHDGDPRTVVLQDGRSREEPCPHSLCARSART